MGDTLYETILERSVSVPAALKDAMRRAVVIKVQNVAEYYFHGTDQENWTGENFPNGAPPWPLFWMEWTMPRQFRSEKTPEITVSPTAGMRTGVLMHAMREGTGWRYGATVMGQANRSADVGGIGLVQIDVNERGGVAISDSATIFLVGGRSPYDVPLELSRYAVDLARVSTHIPLLAISFCHCRNTEVALLAPARGERRRAQRDGQPILRLYTLDIEPVRQILNREGAARKMGLKQALHICRGHFKDYRERGLFGKIKGLFWWDMHVRGNADRGSVGKDYRVEGHEAPLN